MTDAQSPAPARPRRRLRRAAWLLLAALAFGIYLAARPAFAPTPDPASVFHAHLATTSADGVSVEAAAVGAADMRRAFGVDLAGAGVQPIWISIRNDTAEPLRFLPAAIDPDYLAPVEVAFRFHRLFDDARNVALDEFFAKLRTPSGVPPKSTASGFVFTNQETGLKYLRVALDGPSGLRRLSIVLDVPGGAFMGRDVSAEKLYPGKTPANLSEAQLGAQLRALPCCATDRRGKGQGDPLNLAIVEARDQSPASAIAEAGWHLTEKLTIDTAIDTALAFVTGRAYESSPVSPLYLFGRPEDTALQRARATISRRNHLRLWLAPFEVEGRRVWVGQISKDIGVRVTDKSWYLATHRIGPDVDFDRDDLLQQLLLGGSVEAYGTVGGVDPATPEQPRRNLTGDPYFTDGRRLVVFLSSHATPVEKARVLSWKRAPAGG